MNETLEDFSAPALTAAIEANMIGQYRAIYAHWPSVEVHDEPEMTWVTSNLSHPFLNCVLRAQFAPGEVSARIEATLAHFRSRRLPMAWYIGSSTQPADLGKHLMAHGLTHAVDETGMAVDLLALNESQPAPAGLVIEHVSDVETLPEWLHLTAIGFGYTDFVSDILLDLYTRLGFGSHRPWRLYIGFLEGELVAASRLFLAAGVAGVYSVATVPAARRRGIGTAMTLAPLRDARSMGYRIGVLRAARMGLGVYRRLGFEEYCKFGVYVWRGDVG
jgi:ribosomal protein S18 acetylase RimI-like enzyme